MTTWGIHNDTLTTELLDEGFVSVGWDEVGDLRSIGDDQEAVKSRLRSLYPHKKPRAIASWAGILRRFAFIMQPGDVIVAPYKPDGTVNLGVVSGDYYFDADASVHQHRRPVDWRVVGIPRAKFSQSALYEIGAFITIFRISRHEEEFRAALDAGGVEEAQEHLDQREGRLAGQESPAREVELDVPAVDPSSGEDEDRITAGRVDRLTRDFVLSRLQRPWVSDAEFEQLTADILQSMGYIARVTQYSRDGGVDVLAHRDPLGIEPPLIKVQCKHTTNRVSVADVRSLVGTLDHNEVGVFVTLGSYPADALNLERSRQRLRLISGEELVELFLTHYEELPRQWRALVPLSRVYVVDDTAEE
ncbi:restriction system protein [Kytococcus aerolatus]|uniref:Restriction system protein n=1 Tax=Kytococcus aerolatus TaxID=592308 RepID=A0A212TDE1_9MICO|nr:restriction endonuclease [Kytococcus aerolatus]SNC63844.1 restriction system protein [Kytococcus aerolatus]